MQQRVHLLTGGEAIGQASQTGGGSVPKPLPCSVMQCGKDHKAMEGCEECAAGLRGV